MEAYSTRACWKQARVAAHHQVVLLVHWVLANNIGTSPPSVPLLDPFHPSPPPSIPSSLPPLHNITTSSCQQDRMQRNRCRHQNFCLKIDLFFWWFYRHWQPSLNTQNVKIEIVQNVNGWTRVRIQDIEAKGKQKSKRRCTDENNFRWIFLKERARWLEQCFWMR